VPPAAPGRFGNRRRHRFSPIAHTLMHAIPNRNTLTWHPRTSPLPTLLVSTDLAPYESDHGQSHIAPPREYLAVQYFFFFCPEKNLDLLGLALAPILTTFQRDHPNPSKIRLRCANSFRGPLLPQYFSQSYIAKCRRPSSKEKRNHFLYDL